MMPHRQVKVGEIVAVLGDALTLLAEPDPQPDYALASVTMAHTWVQLWRKSIPEDERGNEAGYTGHTIIDARNWVREVVFWVLRADGDGWYTSDGAWYSQDNCLSHAEHMLARVIVELTGDPA